jgi:hypothetical protein
MTPQNLDEAVTIIIDQLSNSDIAKAKHDKDLIVKVHHGFGRHIRNKWSLWNRDSKLSQWFRKNLDIGHAHDISSIIMEAVQAKIRGEEYDPAPTVQRFHEHWENFGRNHFGEEYGT